MTTIYKETSKYLGSQLKSARLDHISFENCILPCELSKCKATCCHDGVHLSSGDAKILGELVDTHSDQLSEMGLDVSAPLFEEMAPNKSKTMTRVALGRELANDFPAHFPKTRCIFLDEQHRCMLQRLANDLGHSPWYFKPLTCWIHPILVMKHEGDLLITLPSLKNDPQKAKNYIGYGACTHCGRAEKEGEPARVVLKNELAELGGLAGRDLLQELNSPEVDW